MLILVWVAVLRAAGSQSGNSSAAEYAVIALLAAAVGLIVFSFIKVRTRRASKPEAGPEGSRWEAFLRSR